MLKHIIAFGIAITNAFIIRPSIQTRGLKSADRGIHQNKYSSRILIENSQPLTQFAGSFLEEETNSGIVNPVFDPLELSSPHDWSSIISSHPRCSSNIIPTTLSSHKKEIASTDLIPSLVSSTLIVIPIQGANAAEGISAAKVDVNNFRPICPASDAFYRVLQATAESLVGSENAVEYAPLISGGLLRIRLELCVIESFFGEAVVPFVQREGLGWVLPLRETVETFLAGTIFALASTFILVGSSKLITVVITYADAFVGLPCRLLGGFGYDRARGLPITFDIGFGPFKKRLVGPPITKKGKGNEEEENGRDWSEIKAKDLPFALTFGAVKAVGETSRVFKGVSEGVDLFVGRYLSVWTTAYIGLKFVHFKIFPDFPPM